MFPKGIETYIVYLKLFPEGTVVYSLREHYYCLYIISVMHAKYKGSHHKGKMCSPGEKSYISYVYPRCLNSLFPEGTVICSPRKHFNSLH